MVLTAAPPAESDLEALSRACADLYFPHHLVVKGHDSGVRTLKGVDLGPVRLARIGWGADVAVESDHPGAWAINVPTSGVLEARVADRHVLSLSGQATLCPPDVATRMVRWSADCSIIGMRIDRDYLDREVTALVGLSTRAMPRQLDVRSDGARAWLALLTSVGSALLQDPTLARDRTVGERLAASVTAALVNACFPEEPGCGTVRPRIVTAVVDAMEADPAREWTAADLAEVSGVGVRRLQQGFRRYLGTTPTATLQSIRLERVHADLLSGRAASVAEAAYRWGFTHLGRFAAAYRQKYGVSPSRQLRG